MHVRDLRNRVDPRRRRSRPARGDERNARPPRAGLRRRVPRRPASGSQRGGSRSSTSPPATSRSRTRTARITVVQNGEIYNYRELRNELERAGHRFSTSGDTEVLVHLYEEHGERFVDRLRGMFAVALWDSERGRLVLARDRYGIKPLYYREAERTSSRSPPSCGRFRVVRSTSTRSRRSSRSTRSRPADDLPRRAQAPAGARPHVGERPHRADAVRAADAPVSADEVRDDEEAELVEELRARLRDSVRAHLVSDVPVGVLLSGGVDSSVLAALAAEEAAEPLRTFSIGFEERSFDELADARLVAERYGTEHHELVLRPDAALLLPALAEAFDEPFADSSALPTYLVSQLAADDVKVALSGEGGDELFGGYYTYAADLLAERAGWTAPLLRPFVDRLPSSSARRASTIKAKRFVALRTCRPSSGIMAGRRSSRRMLEPS